MQKNQSNTLINSRYKKSPLNKGLFFVSYKYNYYLVNFLYLLLNLSIRPAVSINFILPVKNGCEV